MNGITYYENTYGFLKSKNKKIVKVKTSFILFAKFRNNASCDVWSTCNK